MKKRFFLLSSLCVSLLFGAEPVFTAGYDENFSGTLKGKVLEGKVSQELLWETLQNLLQPGLRGNGAVIGTSPDKTKLYHAVYRNTQAIDPFEGTVSFCVKPLTWNGTSKDFHVLFQAAGPDATLIIYKYINSPNLMFLLGPSRPVKGKYLWSMAGASVKKWQAGQWHHIAAAYDRQFIELFLDGRRVSKLKRKALPQKGFNVFSAGAISPRQWKTPLGLTLLDELKIFDKKLSYSDIARLAAVCVKNTRQEISETATIVNRPRKELDLYFTLEGTAVRAEVKLIRNKKTFFVRKLTSLKAQNKVTLSLKKLTPGEYTIVIRGLDDKDQQLCARQILFTLPRLPESWRGNQLGKSTKVPAPWEPLKRNKKTNSISGRTFRYDFGTSPLPRQIHAAGQPLFSRPAELRLNGRPLAISGKISAAAVQDKETFTTVSKTKDFDIRSQVICHFDGFTEVKIELHPRSAKSVSSLVLDFPFKKAASTLFNSMNKFYMHYEKGHCGLFKNYTMNLYTRPPAMFVGNDDCGLQWFCEKMPHWYNRDKGKALQLIRGEKENLLRLNLIDKKVQIDKPLVYEFFLQSVPMRPMPANWRLQCPYRNFDPYFVWSRYHHYPYADALRTDKAYEKLYKTKTRQFGKQLFYYFAGFTITPTFPEWPYYSSEWMLTPPELGLYGCVGNPAAYFTWICPNSEEYRDFYLDRLSTIIRKLDIPNIYIDNSDAQMCGNARHGCGYRGTDGKWYNSFNLRGTRQLAMRTYKMFKELRPRGRIMRHMSAKPVAPVIAFADLLAEGELYNKTVAMDESYFNIFDPAMFRASFCGKLWGVPQFFIPQFTRVIPGHNPKRWHAWKTPQARLKQMDKIRHFKGYFLVHDTQIFPLFGVRVNDVERLKSRFGLRNESKFISYAQKNKPWQSKKEVLVSGYIDRGKLMLVVLNSSKKGTCEITLDPRLLAAAGVRNLALINAETQQPAAVKNNKILLKLAPRDYAILWNIK